MWTNVRFMLVVAAFLLLCALPTPASAQSSDSVIPVVSGDSSIGPAAGNQVDPYIEKGGDMYLAVWVDDRTTLPGDSTDFATGRDIYAARLDSSGEPVDTVPIVLSDALGDQTQARACWNGSDWLVTWYSREPSEVSYVRGLEGVRVSPTGKVLDAEPFLIYPDPSGGITYLDTASDGADWVVFLSEEIYNGFDSDFYLKGARISPSGTPVGVPNTLFSPSCCYFFPLGSDAVYSDGMYLIVFECIPDIYAHDAICGMRVTQSLGNIDYYPFEISLSDDVFRLPLAATNGTDFLVGWYHYIDYPPTLLDPFCARVTHDGVSLDPSGIDLAGGVGAGGDRRPRVAWDRTNWIAVWPDNLGARAARITTGGTVLDPGGVSFAGLGVNDIVDLPGGVRIIWSDKDAGGDRPADVFNTYISGSLSAGPETPTALGAPAHLFADAASGDTDAMIVFRSDISGEHRIMAQTATDYGAARAEPTQLASGPFVTDPEVAWNGTLYLAVWSDEATDTVYGSRVQADGTMIDDPPFAVMSGGDPDVAAVGGDFLVVATDEVGGPTVRKTYAVRVRGSDATVLDPTPILVSGSFAVGPKVAGMASRWIVTWEQHPAYDDEVATVWAAFVDTDGTTPGQFGVATNLTLSDTHYSPDVASSPGMAVIVWEDNRVQPAGYDPDWNVYGRRVRIDGLVYDDPDGFPIATGTSDEQNSAIAFNGSTYQVAYEVSNEVGYFNRSVTDIHGARIDQFGAVLAPGSFVIADTDAAEASPAVTGSGGQGLVVTSDFVKGAPYAAYRLSLRELSDGLTGVSEPDAEPSGVRLIGAFPNPTDGSATIRFSIPERGVVSLRVYDVAGRLVRELADGIMSAGQKDVEWDGRDSQGNEVAAGLYLYRLQAGSDGRSGKIAILR